MLGSVRRVSSRRVSRYAGMDVRKLLSLRVVEIAHMREDLKNCVSLAPHSRYSVNLHDTFGHIITHLVVYIIVPCRSLNRTSFCVFSVCTVLPHSTD